MVHIEKFIDKNCHKGWKRAESQITESQTTEYETTESDKTAHPSYSGKVTKSNARLGDLPHLLGYT